MKNPTLLTIVLLLSGTFGLMAQRPEKVLRITRELHSEQWYEQQAQSWKKYLQTHASDASGWQSYYEANRALRNLGGKPLEDLDAIVKAMKNSVPTSFEYNYLVYRQGGISTAQNLDRFSFLEKAHMIDPSRTEVLEEFVTHYELMWEPEKRKAFNIKRYQANDIPYELLTYNYNVLMSLEPNAILITNGDNDTYPLWLLQDALDVRTDVIVLNRSLAFEQTYLNRLLKHYQVPAFTRSLNSQAEWNAYHDALRSHLLTSSNRPLYYALTVSPESFAEVKDKLYVVGLASRYSEKRFDNTALLARNFEQKFLLDYLRTPLQFKAADSPEGLFEQAYLMPMLSLHRYYQTNAQKEEAKALEQLILQIARRSGREAEVKAAMD